MGVSSQPAKRGPQGEKGGGAEDRIEAVVQSGAFLEAADFSRPCLLYCSIENMRSIGSMCTVVELLMTSC